MNSYSDISFYIQELIINEDNEGSVLLMCMGAPDRPKEYYDFLGIKINKEAFKNWLPIDDFVWANPMTGHTRPWTYEVETIISHDPLEYKVTREKAPLYEMVGAGVLTKYQMPIMKADPPGGTLFEIGPVTPCPMPKLKHNIWSLIYDGSGEEKWIVPIDYIKTEIHLDARPEIPVKTIDITFNIEKEDDT